MKVIVGDLYRIKEDFIYDGLSFVKGEIVKAISHQYGNEAYYDRLAMSVRGRDRYVDWYVPKGNLIPISSIKDKLKELIDA